MNRKLIAFGDSFISTQCVAIQPPVLKLLAMNLDMEFVNYACCGSSLQFTVTAFLRYRNSPEYSEDDILLFFPTNNNRVWAKSMPHPGLSVYVDPVKTRRTNLASLDKKWINENADYLLWCVDELYDQEMNFETIKAVSVFKTVFSKNLSVIVGTVGSGIAEAPFLEKLTTDKCLSLLDSNIKNLTQVSIHEFTSESLFYEHVSVIDDRVNHLSPVNRKILANMLTQVITTRDISKYDPKYFITDIYSTVIPSTEGNFL